MSTDANEQAFKNGLTIGEVMKNSDWDKNLAAQLRAIGMSHDNAMIVVGIVAEMKQLAYMSGYKKGFDAGHAKGKEKTVCVCGNPEMGFDCTCEWTRENPGNTLYSCEFCGLYTAGKSRCNKCEVH